MGHAVTVTDEKFEFSAKAKRFTFILMIAGALLTGLGIFLASRPHDGDHKDHHAALLTAQNSEHDDAKPLEGAPSEHPAKSDEIKESDHKPAAHGADEKHWTGRVWGNLLLNSYFFMIIAIAGTVFIAINYLANAGWATALKRIPEAMGTYLPIGLITVMLVAVFGKDMLYKWTDPVNVDASELLTSKTWFLNYGFLYVGVPVMVGVWMIFHFLLRKASLKEDLAEPGTVKFMDASIKYSSIFIFFFAFSFSAISWLLVMSIEAEWFSTMFSVNQFAISWVSGLSTIALITIYLKSKGYLTVVTDEHLHDLGKFIFAFSIFWTYTWVSQYLLIWYANLPEEVIYYKSRTHGHFGPYFWLTFVLSFIVPFLGLMSRNSKRNPKVLATVAVLVIIGHWIDLFVSIHPATTGDTAGIGVLEIGTFMLFAGAFIYFVLNQLSKASLYAKNHPYLMESVHHDTGV